MAMRTKQRPTAPVRQRGAALVVGLIFLAMLSLMGVAAYMVASQEERMSGNTRDRIRAFEAAEASLRDCEAVLGVGTLPETFDGTGGMHTAPAFGAPQVYETINWLTDPVRKFDDNNPALPDVALQPRCIVERVGEIEVRRLDDERSGPLEVSIEVIYRITAMGYGTNPSTTMNLQTMFRRPE